jgi:2-polyprenyl-6-methoxyphenol hydroxylase-like FAD-dependent oxidoreductase/phytoene/squalene synthetase
MNRENASEPKSKTQALRGLPRQFRPGYAEGSTPARHAVVVGGGPAGCVAALKLAKTGATVLLLEAAPEAKGRLAGEWLHPPAAKVLRALGVFEGKPAPRTGHGFVVLPHGEEPITLPYPDGETALAWEHSHIVTALRDAALAHPNIEIACGARVERAVPRVVRWHHPERGLQVTETDLIVGADGRASNVRKQLGGPERGTPVSWMAGVLLEGAELPYEGMGHVVLGGPGPVLAYRISETEIRLCIDVPLADGQVRMDTAALLAAYGPHLPEPMRRPFQEALAARRPAWAALRVMPRRFFGTDGVLLVGDAVGHVHPLTAVGITLGFGDAMALDGRGSVAEYRRAREATSHIPEVLAGALYGVFTSDHPGAAAIREAVQQGWRKSPAERAQTMRLLSGQETRATRFAHSFVRVAGRAARGATARQIGTPAPLALVKEAGAVAPWLRWPLLGSLPPALRGALSDRQGLWLEASLKARQPAKAVAAPAPSPIAPRPVTAPATTMADDERYCWEALEAVSRTFVRPIQMLPGHLRTAVCCGYLLCRIADTVEDSPTLPISERSRLFGLLLRVLTAGAPAETFTAALPASFGVPEEELLSRSLHRVLRVLGQIPEDMQRTCLEWTAEMARGMEIYAHRPADKDGIVSLLTVSDLERYCYFVAGTVGHMLTDLFCEAIPTLGVEREQVLRECAEGFGTGLQLVNILKDVTDDRERRWSFLPRSACARVGLTPAELLDVKRRPLAHAAIAPLFDRAEEHLHTALTYALAIPEGETGIRLFCLLPLWMAVRTLQHARGNDAVFTPGQPVKIPRSEVEACCHPEARADPRLRPGRPGAGGPRPRSVAEGLVARRLRRPRVPHAAARHGVPRRRGRPRRARARRGRSLPPSAAERRRRLPAPRRGAERRVPDVAVLCGAAPARRRRGRSRPGPRAGLARGPRWPVAVGVVGQVRPRVDGPVRVARRRRRPAGDVAPAAVGAGSPGPHVVPLAHGLPADVLAVGSQGAAPDDAVARRAPP